MARNNIGSPDEAVAGMANNGRMPMGNDAFKASAPSATDTGRAVLRPKAGAQAGDPTVGGAAHRSNVAYERMGAHYGVQVNSVAPHLHEAGATQANGRIVPAKTIRSNDSFNAGVQSSY